MFTKLEFPNAQPLNILKKYTLQLQLTIQVKQKQKPTEQEPTEQDFVQTWRHKPSIYNNVVRFRPGPWLLPPKKTVAQVEKVQAKRQKRLFEEDKKDKYKQIEDSQQAKKGKYNHEPSPGFTVPTKYQKVSRKKETCRAQSRKRLASDQVSEYLQAVKDSLGPNAQGKVPKGTLESPFV